MSGVSLFLWYSLFSFAFYCVAFCVYQVCCMPENCMLHNVFKYRVRVRVLKLKQQENEPFLLLFKLLYSLISSPNQIHITSVHIYITSNQRKSSYCPLVSESRHKKSACVSVTLERHHLRYYRRDVTLISVPV